MNVQLESFVLTFVPLFIVIDALGNLPFVIALSEGMPRSQQRRMIHVAMATAAVLGLAFLFLGQAVLTVIGISVGSFTIAGGIILLALSVKYLTTGRMVEVIKEEMVAVVPIGTPLTVGPATITTLMLLVAQFPLYVVLVSFILNIFVSWVVFLLSHWFVRFMGRGGLRAVSQVFNLLLAAIGVSMVLRGLDLVGIIQLAA